MRIEENLTCSFQVLRPEEKGAAFRNRPKTPIKRGGSWFIQLFHLFSYFIFIVQEEEMYDYYEGYSSMLIVKEYLIKMYYITDKIVNSSMLFINW